MFIIKISKYQFSIKKKFLSYLFKSQFPSHPSADFEIYQLLFDETYYISFLRSPFIINKNLIETFAITEFLWNNQLLYPLVIDSANLFTKALQIRASAICDKQIYIEIITPDNKTKENIEESLIKGGILIIKDPDEVIKYKKKF